MYLCIPMCGSSIAHLVSLYVRIRMCQSVYTNSYFWLSHYLSEFVYTNYQARIVKRNNCLLWLSAHQVGVLFLAIWPLYLQSNRGFFMLFISMHFHICILRKFVLEIASCLLTKMKQSTDHLRLSSKLPVILSSQLLCFVRFTVSGWLLRRIYSLCLTNVIVEKFMVRLLLFVLIRIYELTISKFCCIITFLTEEWLYKLFMHQACVFENKYQYDMSNMILSNVISDAFTKGHIKQPLKDAIEAFQIKLNNKQRYLAFYIRKKIHNCYDAMTTSPCESMNSHIKNSSKATTLNNTR